MAQRALRASLADGSSKAENLAIARKALEILEGQSALARHSSLAYEPMSREYVNGATSPEKLLRAARFSAVRQLFPHKAVDEVISAYKRKYAEYVYFTTNLLLRKTEYLTVRDNKLGTVQVYIGNPAFPELRAVFADELIRWYESYPVDREFYLRGFYLTWPVNVGVGQFLSERPDMAMMFQLAQEQAWRSESYNIEIDRPMAVQMIEMAVGLIPLVGSVAALYEAYSGIDLCGYRLTTLERVILAAAVLLPVAGRLVKNGRAMYSAQRLASMYGHDTAAWKRTIAAGKLASSYPEALRPIGEAEKAMAVSRALDRELRRKAALSISQLVNGHSLKSSQLDGRVLEAFRQLSSQHKILQSIDEFAMERVLRKGPNVDFLKGQLLEELVESRVVPMLQDRAGSYGLGVRVQSARLQFVPGHLVRDLKGRQISDGLLVYRNKGAYEIVAVFEAKAGQRGSRELGLKSGSLSSLSAEDRVNLRAYARDVLREEREAARLEGRSFDVPLSEIEDSIVQSERGGQVRSDVERFYEFRKIRIGNEVVPIDISPTRTKFFCVLPKDVRSSALEKQLEAVGYKYEIIGVDISSRDLQDIAGKIRPIAQEITWPD